MSRRWMACGFFLAAIGMGTALDGWYTPPSRPAGMLVGDFHVHPFPGDGTLTVAQLQREARRRGIDVLAITGHNNRAGLLLSAAFETPRDDVLVLPGQELTAPDFHMIAAGIERLVPWQASAVEAIDAVHAQGGVAIAAHPLPGVFPGWTAAAKRTLDGSEVMHPLRLASAEEGAGLDAFFSDALAVNPSLAAIGSTDFHIIGPLGLCRTYLLTSDRSAAGALDAIRQGRTVAQCAGGPLIGRPEDVARVERQLGTTMGQESPEPMERGAALLGLLALGGLVLPGKAR